MKTLNTIADWRVLIIDQLERNIRSAGLHNKSTGCRGNFQHRFFFRRNEVRFVELFSDIATKWPESTGNYQHPIKHPKYGIYDFELYKIEDVWAGEFGERRKRFCSFAIDELKAMTDKELSVYIIA